ncbi:hypothetical protein NXC12_CH00130 [Rhizobium etli]|uniref:Uncharacterized protein n=1 Tax=Rhizobium etli TaxID=29449 RepID=A0AAN1EI28_RHIET|nr:hypothetical protein NXC12_CH00130 [Rhizobium etli]
MNTMSVPATAFRQAGSVLEITGATTPARWRYGCDVRVETALISEFPALPAACSE